MGSYTDRKHAILRSPLHLGEDDSLQCLERLESSLLASGVDLLENEVAHGLILAYRREVVL